MIFMTALIEKILADCNAPCGLQCVVQCVVYTLTRLLLCYPLLFLGRTHYHTFFFFNLILLTCVCLSSNNKTMYV